MSSRFILLATASFLTIASLTSAAPIVGRAPAQVASTSKSTINRVARIRGRISRIRMGAARVKNTTPVAAGVVKAKSGKTAAAVKVKSVKAKTAAVNKSVKKASTKKSTTPVVKVENSKVKVNTIPKPNGSPI